MKTPVAIIVIMLCFSTLSHAQNTKNRAQELKEQAQNSLSQKDYIKARYLLKKRTKHLLPAKIIRRL